MFNPTAYKRKLKVFHNAYSPRLRQDRTFSLLLFVKAIRHKIILSEEERPWKELKKG